MVDYSKFKGPTPDITYDIDIGLPYGKMPDEALMAKFEQTNEIDDVDEIYDNYGRSVLKDTRVDPPAFEYEEPRKSINNKGFINSRYYGGRGEYNYPAHPEINTELTEKDPRRTFTDPDFRELRMQEDARMRFVRWGSGNDDNVISGGHLRENQIRDSKKHMFKLVKPRLRIFSTSMDGRREGLRRSYAHKSVGRDVDYDKTYGDIIKDWALNPQRKTIILSNDLIRNSKWYHQHTPDHIFTVAKYGEDPRKMRLNISENKVQMYEGDSGKYSHDLTCDELTMVYKHIGTLMGILVNQKHQIQLDTEKTESNDAQIRKLSELRSDIERLLFETVHDSDWSSSDTTQSRKQPSAKSHKPVMCNRDDLRPANYYHEAMLMFKSINPSSDIVSVKFSSTNDSEPAKLHSTETLARKTCKRLIKSGIQDTIMEVDGTSLTIKSYKSPATQPNENKKQSVNPEEFGSQEDSTQNRKVSHIQQRGPDPNDTETNSPLIPTLDNSYIDHFSGRTGRLDNKLKIRRYSDHENNEVEPLLTTKNSA